MEVACPPPAGLLSRRSAGPTFSVVIAAYQVADCIGEAIASALGQTQPPHEVIVCDDGSTDDLGRALAPFAGRIVVIRQENRGEAAAKNAAIRAATAEFVAILDADDVYLPGRLAALGELARGRPDLRILTSDAHLEAGGRRVRRVYGPAWRFEVADQRAEILRRNFIFGHAAVHRQTLLAAGGFDESIRRTTDWECWIRLILDGASAGAVLEPLAVYRVRETSLSGNRPAMLEGSLQTLRAALRHPQIRPHERVIAEATIVGIERRLAPLLLVEALREGAPGVRRQALRLMLAAGATPATRLKAAGAAIAPRAAGRLLSHRGGATWVGAGGTRVRRD